MDKSLGIGAETMIWIILTVGLLIRLFSLNQSLWLDEAINVVAAKSYSFFGLITQYAIADFHPPGYSAFLWFWTRVFGISEISIRVPSIIFGVLTIYIIFLIGKKIHSKTLGFLAATLLAINPLHIFYSQEARMYALATLAVSFNIFLLIKYIKGEKTNLLFLIISNLLVLASDYVAYFIFPAQLVFLLIKKKALLKKWFTAFVIAVLIGIWWLPIFLSQLDVGSVASNRLPAWKLIVGSFDPKAVPLTFVKFIIGRISYPDKLIYALILLPISTLFLFLLWRGVKFIKKLDRNLILSWVFVPVILAFLVSLVIPIYSYFRLLFVLPAFIILVSLGLLSLGQKIRYIFLAAVIFIELVSASVYLFNPVYQRDDWKGLVNFLKSKGTPVVLFESSGTLPPFDYYSKGEINSKGGLKDFPAKDILDVADLEKILQDKREVYLVEYLVEISDPQRYLQKRLMELDFKEIEIINFNGVGFVYHYKK